MILEKSISMSSFDLKKFDDGDIFIILLLHAKKFNTSQILCLSLIPLMLRTVSNFLLASSFDVRQPAVCTQLLGVWVSF